MQIRLRILQYITIALYTLSLMEHSFVEISIRSAAFSVHMRRNVTLQWHANAAQCCPAMHAKRRNVALQCMLSGAMLPCNAC